MKKNTLTLIFILTVHLLCGQEEIHLGMSAALSGPSGNLGRNMRMGIEAALMEYNTSQNSHRVYLHCLDDAYIPEKAEENMRELCADERILAFIGNVGTPTTQRALPIAQEHDMLFFGPMTGATSFRDSLSEAERSRIVHFRASYREEMRVLVDWMLKADMMPADVALFIQDDGFGNQILQLAVEQFAASEYLREDEGSEVFHSICRYTRNSWEINQAILSLIRQDHPPKAIILGSTARPAAKFIAKIKPFFPNTWFLVISFAHREQLISDLDGRTDRLVFSQTVPSPFSQISAIRQYRKALNAYIKSRGLPTLSEQEYNTINLEGYLAGRVFIERFLRGKTGLSRASLPEAQSISPSRIRMEEVFFEKNAQEALQRTWLWEPGEEADQ